MSVVSQPFDNQFHRNIVSTSVSFTDRRRLIAPFMAIQKSLESQIITKSNERVCLNLLCPVI